MVSAKLAGTKKGAANIVLQQVAIGLAPVTAKDETSGAVQERLRVASEVKSQAKPA
jgi:hypothetical protein